MTGLLIDRVPTFDTNALTHMRQPAQAPQPMQQTQQDSMRPSTRGAFDEEPRRMEIPEEMLLPLLGMIERTRGRDKPEFVGTQNSYNPSPLSPELQRPEPAAFADGGMAKRNYRYGGAVKAYADGGHVKSTRDLAKMLLRK